MEKHKDPSLADSICDLRRRKVKKTFFQQIDALIDWNTVKKVIDKHYQPQKRSTGKPAYSGLMLFKMSLLQTWYGLSDYEVEDRVNDSLSFSYFLGMNIEEAAPDHSTLSRFRSRMTKAEAYDPIFQEVNRQLEEAGIIVKTGALVDASIIDTPLKPKGRARHMLDQDKESDGENDGEGEEQIADKQQDDKERKPKTSEKEVPPSVDKDGAWVKKGGKVRYGYKKHHITDREGLMIGVMTTPGNVHETSMLEELLDLGKLEKGTWLGADKGYVSKKNSKVLEEKGLKDRILKKAKRGKQLRASEKRFNKLVGRLRYKVERGFGSIKRWFGGGTARYRGIAKMHSQNLLEALCHNLYRSPGIIASKAQKSA